MLNNSTFIAILQATLLHLAPVLHGHVEGGSGHVHHAVRHGRLVGGHVAVQLDRYVHVCQHHLAVHGGGVELQLANRTSGKI